MSRISWHRVLRERIDYMYAKVDGTYDFPDSYEGDLIRVVHVMLGDFENRVKHDCSYLDEAHDLLQLAQVLAMRGESGGVQHTLEDAARVLSSAVLGLVLDDEGAGQES